MELNLTPVNRAGTEASTSSSRSFFTRNIIRRERSADDPTKGPLGLTTLHGPEEAPAAVDLIFVHGLNGGSYSTWSKGGDLAYLWPKEWLPKDEAFRDVRIHTFGYSSGLNRESILNIQDFAQSLLASIKDAPTIPRDEKAPLIFVAHSMGGLVVKKAFILGQQISEFMPLVQRVSAIFFLATPHQGADIAKVLSRILAIAPGSRPFVQDLVPTSPAIQSINDEFPQHSSHLQLFSFYETKTMNYGIGTGLIVEKHAAVMHYVNERRTLLNANHRDVARYPSRDDPSYVSVRNALATFIEAERDSSNQVRQEIGTTERTTLSAFLGVHDAPEDDFLAHDSVRLPGSCEWLTQRQSFHGWKDSISKVFWVRGRPGVGKSVISSHVITHLRGLDRDCCFFYFVEGDKTKTSVDSFLRSMAYQMALIHPEILTAIMESRSSWKEAPADKSDHNTIWRRLFLAGILRVMLNRPQYWVIDAMDECKAGTELLNFLSRAQELWPLSVFVTSRDPIETYLNSYNPRIEVISETITENDNEEDISLYMAENMRSLPARDMAQREAMAEHIVRSSRGCFLWTNLVLQELRQVSTAGDIDKVLRSNPSDMEQLYQRILRNMSAVRFGKDLSKAILTWAICSFRPLTIQEAHLALETDIKGQIPDLQHAIETSCGNLVYVDKQKKLQLTHLTVREFLTNKDLDSEFAVKKAEGHRQLALVCLKFLSSSEMKPPKPRRPSVDQSRRPSNNQDLQQKHPLADYACKYLFRHLVNVRSNDDEVLFALSQFLASNNALTWIEYEASRKDLQVLFDAGKTLRNLLLRRAQHSPPLSFHTNRELALLEQWSEDLIHLVTKFGKRLTDCPYSIHQLIPPFCPPESALRQKFCSSFRGLAVLGLASTRWDDCLSTINYILANQDGPTISSNTRSSFSTRPIKPLRTASAKEQFAVGTSTGKIIFYDDTTFQQVRTLEQRQEPVWYMVFSQSEQLLATAGANTVTVWDLQTGVEKYRFRLKAMCIALVFLEDDTVLYGVMKNNELLCWDLFDGTLGDEPVNWTRDEEVPRDLQTRSPQAAIFCAHMGLLAILYRGQDLLLWDIEAERLYDIYEKETGSRKNYSTKVADGATWVWDVTFSAMVETSLIAAAYSDGDVIVYDMQRGTPIGTLTGLCPQIISSSPDGRTLVTADSRGDIQLFDFETLKFLYHIQFDTDVIMTKALKFTWDSQRLIELRGPQCRIWGPSVLLRHDIDDENSDTVSITTGPQEVEHQSTDSLNITAVAYVRSQPFVFCGKEDGSVHVYDISNEPQSQPFFVHSAGYFITLLQFDAESGILSCCDASNTVTSRRVIRKSKADWEVSEMLLETRPLSPVYQLIGSGRHSRLMVSTKDHDTLWKLRSGDDKTECIKTITGSDKPRWVMHPTNPNLLIHLSENKATTYNWTTLEYLASYDLILPESMLCTIAIPLNNSRFFASLSKGPSEAAGTTRPCIQIWDFKDFELSTKSTQPAMDLDWLAPSVQEIIGVSRNRLVFLNTDYWVCSVDLSPRRLSAQAAEQPGSSDPANQIVRHFFVPYDWISLANNLHLDIGKNGEIIFVKRSELAVIKRGLEVTDSGPFNVRRGASPMMDLPSRPYMGSRTSS